MIRRAPLRAGIFLRARRVNQFTFARRKRRYHWTTCFPAGPLRISYLRAAIAGVTEFAARHLPLARATSLESWLDLSGAPDLRAGFFAGKSHARADHLTSQYAHFLTGRHADAGADRCRRDLQSL